MPWITAIAIVVAATLINQLGLIAAIEKVIGKAVKREVQIPVLNCSKCLSFWATVVLIVAGEPQHTMDAWEVVAMPPLMAYAAWWLELLLGYLGHLYNKAYDTLYTDAGLADSEPLSSE